MKTTTAVIHETRRTLSDGTHPVKLRITHNRKQKYYTLNVSDNGLGLSVDDWKKVNTERPRGQHKAIRDTLNVLEGRALEVIKSLPEFTFTAFEASFYNHQSAIDLFSAMTATANSLRKEGRIKTALTYENAVKSLKAFARKDKLLFSVVTPEYLRRYEKWMLTAGKTTKTKEKAPNSPTTISIYLRNVRAAFNKAGIKEEAYPFGRGKYEIPNSRNVKKALTIQDIAKIFRYDAPPQSMREKYRDYWLLSYFCNGANIKDLAQLKYKDIDGDAITFIRSKTKRKNRRAVVVPLTVEIARLIDRHGTRPALPDAYVLPILSVGMTPEQQQVAIDNAVRAINKHIKVIAQNIGLSTNVSTYTARHSFATVLKRSGASIEFISESLGHKNLTTTENYLADFELDEKRKMAANLTNWENG